MNNNKDPLLSTRICFVYISMCV